jgi:Gas vesicle protein
VVVAERDLVPRGGLQPSPFQQSAAPPAHTGPSSLADILERVLDKGIVIAGDIQINLLEIELLTIKLRLLIASVDRAREMGINWWESDPSLSSETKQLEQENRSLRERLERLEEKVGLPSGEDDGTEAGEDAPARRSRDKR